MKKLLLITAATLTFAGTAQAQNFQYSAEAGFGFGTMMAEEQRTTFPDEGSASTYSLFGRASIELNNGIILAFDHTYRRDDLASTDDFDSFEDPEQFWDTGLHALYRLTDETLVGGFVSYGFQLPQGEDRDDAYDVLTLGLQMQTFLTPDMLFYTQVGLSNGFDDQGNETDEGIRGGTTFTLGGEYFIQDNMAVGIDVEYAASESYIDGDASGWAAGVSLGFDYMLETSFAPIILNADAGYNRFSTSPDEDDHVDDAYFSIGASVLFGNTGTSLRDRANTGRNLDAPVLITRLAGWTEYLD